MADSESTPVPNDENLSWTDKLAKIVAKQGERIVKLEENFNSMDRADKAFASLSENFSQQTRLEKIIDKQDEEISKLKGQLRDHEDDIAMLKEKVYQLAKESGWMDIARVKADYDLAQRKWFLARASILEHVGNTATSDDEEDSEDEQEGEPKQEGEIRQ